MVWLKRWTADGRWQIADCNEEGKEQRGDATGGRLPALQGQIDGRAGREGAQALRVAAAAGVVAGGVRRKGSAIQA